MKSVPPGSDANWFISALGIAQICSWGTLFYGFPLIAEAMRLELGWSKPTLYGAATLGVVLASFAAYPVGNAIDRGHGRWLMAGASVIAGGLLVAWSRVESIAAFYVVLATLGCMQAATLYEPAFAVIARRVGAGGARRGITALTLWGGFASTVFIPLIQICIDAYGWRGALLVMAGVNTLVCGSLYFVAIDPRRDAHTLVRRPDEPVPLSGRQAVAAAMRKPAYWGLMVALIAYAAGFSALTYHLFPLLIERGLDAASVALVLAAIGPAQVVGRVAVLRLMPASPIRRVGSVVVAMMPIAVLGFTLAPPDVTIIAGIAVVYGAANGIITIVRGLAVPEMITRDAYGAVNGSLVGPMNFMQALAPLGAALLWEATGGYDAVLGAILVAALLLCGGFWFAARHARE
jgi:predicted MFS family arabinose efflux permease